MKLLILIAAALLLLALYENMSGNPLLGMVFGTLSLVTSLYVMTRRP